MILTEFPDILTIVIRQLEVRMCLNHRQTAIDWGGPGEQYSLSIYAKILSCCKMSLFVLEFDEDYLLTVSISIFLCSLVRNIRTFFFFSKRHLLLNVDKSAIFDRYPHYQNSHFLSILCP